MADSASESLLETPLVDLHRELGGKMVPFAGYLMPVQYTAGIMAEHLGTRAGAALFDVSHMGQAELVGEGAADALERVTPGDIRILKPGKQKYALLTTDEGGIQDDFMVANLGDRLFIVANASRKGLDFDRIASVLPDGLRLRRREDWALLAFQGPKAVELLSTLCPDVSAMGFMGIIETTLVGAPAIISRSGYSGEDGVEISIPDAEAEKVARALLALPGAIAAGLGARDSLRLEAGLCLYGNDIDETTSPVEANLVWTIGKRRRTEWNFPGADRVRSELDNGAKRLRVGIQPEGRQPARQHVTVHAADGAQIGEVTSGGFGPSVNAPVAMGYVAREHAVDGTPLTLMVRGKPLAARVAPMPFHPHRYVR